MVVIYAEKGQEKQHHEKDIKGQEKRKPLEN